jgi:tetratricopeptide (TPR) repeat protein
MAEEEKSPEKFFERMRLSIDPDNVDESVHQLRDWVRKTVENGRYTKVRLLYKGKPLTFKGKPLPDIPVAALIATGAATFWWTGPLNAILINLGVSQGIRVFVDVELIHEADELVEAGIAHYLEGEVDAAEAKYRAALEKKSDDTAALYNLGVLLRVTGRREEAMESFERAARDTDHPDSGRAKDALEKMKKGPRVL